MEAIGHCGYQGTETTSSRVEVLVLDMSSNTWEEVIEMSTSRSTSRSTMSSCVEEVWEGLRWQKEDEKKTDGVVTCGKESVSMDDDSFMEYE